MAGNGLPGYGYGFYERGARLWMEKMAQRAINRMRPDYGVPVMVIKPKSTDVQAWNKYYYETNRETIRSHRKERYRQLNPKSA
jgi:hypothetical protein